MMKVKVEIERTVGDLVALKKEKILQVNGEYQRGLRWTETQKRMFIDSVFRGYSIPAFYFHRKERKAGTITNTYYEIVDGQQRIDAIYSFSEGSFTTIDPLQDSGFRFPNYINNEECPWGGMRYSELSDELKNRLNDHKVVVYEVITENDNSIRDLFIRLQGGTPLTPQDKRDSWPGNFTEFILRVGGKSGVDKWYGLPLFKAILKQGNESRRRQLAAQVFMLFWSIKNEKRFCNIQSTNIDEFYHSQVGFNENSVEAKRFEDICGKLYEAMRDKPRITGHYIIHLSLFVDSLLDEYVSGWESKLPSSLNEFDNRRKEAADAARKSRNSTYSRYYTEYGQLTQTRSDDSNSIRRRHAFFTEEMLNLLTPTKLDSRRSFFELERTTVFFRDRELCQWCLMNGQDHKVRWADCVLHHISPHASGGETTIENAALVHRDCHPQSNTAVEQFQQWWSNRARELSDH